LAKVVVDPITPDVTTSAPLPTPESVTEDEKVVGNPIDTTLLTAKPVIASEGRVRDVPNVIPAAVKSATVTLDAFFINNSSFPIVADPMKRACRSVV
jgi:hypothetical protein